ncbi:hypothetical protein C8J56DRAFT_1167449 [Mycena floridula]|nr:hypothetical protein C8J56DRAFT_1167449 [Mycena floridula]
MSGPATQPQLISDQANLVSHLQSIIAQQSVALQNANSGRKRRRVNNSVQNMGRGIRRLSSLIDDVAAVALQACEYEIARDIPEESRQLAEDIECEEVERYEELGTLEFEGWVLTEKEKAEYEDLQTKLSQRRDAERIHGSYTHLVRLVPELPRRMETHELDDLLSFYKELNTGANDARCEDLRKATIAVANCLNKDADADKHLFIDPNSRKYRGLEHPATGRLLLAVDHGKYEDVHDDFINGTRDLGDSFYSCAFYHKGKPADMDNLDKRFTMALLPLTVYKTIFTSPSSAKDDKPHDSDEIQPSKKRKTNKSAQATRQCNADLLGMKNTVTPRSIAYACVLAHYSLTSAGTWNNASLRYRGVDYGEMWKFIVDFFEEAKTPLAQEQVKEILQWWNRNVFPDAVEAVAQANGTQSSRSKLARQRAAREAAAAQAAADAAAVLAAASDPPPSTEEQ